MKPRNLISPLLTSMFLVGTPVVHAADGTWTQTVSGGLWSEPGNWSGGTVADGSGSTANFNTIDITGDNAVKLDAPRTLTSLVFGDTDTATAAGWTVDNNGDANNILTLAGTPTVTVNALGTAKLAAISAIIDGSSGLTKAGAGQLLLSGTNTYTGLTSINAGIVQTSNPSAFGASGSGNGTIIGALGQINLSNGSTGMTEDLIINGATQFGNQGALRFTNSNQIYAGALTLGSDSRISGAGGSGMSGTIDLAGFNLSTFMNAGTHLWSAPISGSGSLTIANRINNGGGIITLSGINTYTGITSVTSGILQFAKPASLYNATSESWTDANLVVESGATLAFNVGGTDGFTAEDIAALAELGTGVGGFKHSSRLGLSTANGDFTYSGEITNPNGNSNSRGLTKLGANILTLEGQNTYSGPTTVAAGTLRLAGDSGYVLNSATAITLTGATLDLNAQAQTVTSLIVSGNSVFTDTADGSGGLTTTNESATPGAAPTVSAGGTLDIQGGTFTSANYVTNNGNLVMNGGTLALPNEFLTGFNNAGATFTLNDGLIDTPMLSFGNNASTYRFNGGIARTAKFNRRSTAAVDIFFNGGTIKAHSSGAASLLATFLSGFTAGQNAWISSGGLLLDTDGVNIAMSSPLKHDPLGNETDGGLTKVGAGTVSLSGASTYNGTTTVSEGSLIIGVASTATGTTLLTGATGVGDVILEEGVTLGQSANLWYAETVTLQGNVTLAGNLRQRVGFKNLDLDGGTRTLTLTPTGGNVRQTITGNTALEGTGRNRWEMAPVPNAGTLTVQNGSLALATNLTGDEYAGFMFQFPSLFADNAGLIVGPNIHLQTVAEGALGTTSADTAKLAVNGIWNMQGGGNQAIYSLAGSGRVYTSMVATNATPRAVIINGTAGSTDFSGTLSNGPGTGALSILKTGASTQILSGANTYTGDTTVTGGILGVTGSSIADSNKLVIDGGKVDLSGVETVGTLFFGAVQQAAGTYSATGAGGSIASANFTGAGTLVVASGPGGGYSTWASANAGGQAANLDFDGDGVSNGVEYFMGQTGSSFTPNPQIVTVGGVRTITWPRDPAAIATFKVQISDTLAAGEWTDIVPPHASIDQSNPNQVTYTLPAGSPKKFCRLSVTP